MVNATININEDLKMSHAEITSFTKIVSVRNGEQSVHIEFGAGFSVGILGSTTKIDYASARHCWVTRFTVVPRHIYTDYIALAIRYPHSNTVQPVVIRIMPKYAHGGVMIIGSEVDLQFNISDTANVINSADIPYSVPLGNPHTCTEHELFVSVLNRAHSLKALAEAFDFDGIAIGVNQRSAQATPHILPEMKELTAKIDEVLRSATASLRLIAAR